jgi:hypothetical protein
MPHHFIAKLTPGGGPPPRVELARIVGQAAESENQTAWFATRKPGASWHPTLDGSPCVALIFVRNDDGSIDAVVAEVRDRRTEIPDDPATQDLYRGHEGFAAWWLLADPVAVRLPSLEPVPGTSLEGKTAAEAFVGTLTFGYWSYDPLAQVVAHLRSVDEPLVADAPTPRMRRREVGPPVAGPSGAGATERLAGKPRSDIYGVDFSGGQESVGCGNRKIWVASWDAERGEISLRRGTDEPPLRRADLPALVHGRPGWWVFDFPFGVAQETAAALGIDGNDWKGWLDWCIAGGDATARRDAARAAVEQHDGCRWSARRAVDEEHATTWFPLFEKLYRQTIYGAQDVLKGLVAAPDVALLPWQDPDGARVVVVEGFPGVTIRTHLKLKGIGYKGRQAHHRAEREKIVKGLASVLPVSLPEAVARIAVDDHEGDGLDALVLLLAGWAAQQYPDWKAKGVALTSERRLVEGWFPA